MQLALLTVEGARVSSICILPPLISQQAKAGTHLCPHPQGLAPRGLGQASCPCRGPAGDAEMSTALLLSCAEGQCTMAEPPDTACWCAPRYPDMPGSINSLGLTLGDLSPSLNFIHLAPAPELGVEMKLAFPPTFGQVPPPDLPGQLDLEACLPVCLCPTAHTSISPGSLTPDILSPTPTSPVPPWPARMSLCADRLPR